MTRDLIHDWNGAGAVPPRPDRRIEFDDETLRDGLQSPSVTVPALDRKLEILRLMDSLGLDSADVGLPGAGATARRDAADVVRAMQSERLRIAANCAARTLEADIRPIADIAQETGRPLEAAIFLGSSPLRRYAEGWTMDLLLERTRASVAFAVREGLSVMFTLEDATRARPEDLEQLCGAAVECGAGRICLCDTVGHATPHGVSELVRFVRGKFGTVKIDFHGHMDRGLGVWNSIAAVQAGAHRLHGTALGIGERVGNAPMDQILVNLKLMGWIDNNLSQLTAYCLKVSESAGVDIPNGYPVAGRDAFTTAAGVHAAAVAKALRKGDPWLADRVYSGVPAGEFGRAPEIIVGPMSGRSNVAFWLEHRGIEPTEQRLDAVLDLAKRSGRVLTDAEILGVIG